MGIASAVDTADLHVEAVDLFSNRVPAEIGVAFVLAVTSALKKQQSMPGLLVLGDLSVQGNLKPLPTLAEVLQVAMDNGARRALIPIENKRAFLDVSADIMERVDPVFYGDVMTATLKGLGLT
jgi:ATP-dependent Lon protease